MERDKAVRQFNDLAAKYDLLNAELESILSKRQDESSDALMVKVGSLEKAVAESRQNLQFEQQDKANTQTLLENERALKSEAVKALQLLKDEHEQARKVQEADARKAEDVKVELEIMQHQTQNLKKKVEELGQLNEKLQSQNKQLTSKHGDIVDDHEDQQAQLQELNIRHEHLTGQHADAQELVAKLKSELLSINATLKVKDNEL
mmetsp:Transcript_57412/g.124845  ORF Transcript_57412/g.124845 Transcript_57412/m.124845 type:complete len:205 (+) Transcript_57412:504-1118(+)